RAVLQANGHWPAAPRAANRHVAPVEHRGKRRPRHELSSGARMNPISDFARRLRAAMRREPDPNLAEELRFHLDMESSALEQRGLPPSAARGEARRRFGGVDRYNEELRDFRGGRWVHSLVSDARF